MIERKKRKIILPIHSVFVSSIGVKLSILVTHFAEFNLVVRQPKKLKLTSKIWDNRHYSQLICCA
jgi:hypothetical protein